MAALDVIQGVRTIQLTKGYSAIVDADRFVEIAKFQWHARVTRTQVYAVRTAWNFETKTHDKVLMHRVVADASKGELADHWNGDSLDNRSENLRICNYAQNGGNARKTRGTSKYKGVCLISRTGKWMAQIGNSKKKDSGSRTTYLGCFSTEEEAARAYDKKAIELFGEFANPNFPL